MMLKKILLVEDDLSLGESLKERLEQDYDVDWVKNKSEALNTLSSKNYDLLILDVGLPDGNGFEIVEKKQLANTSIVFLTAQGDAETRLRGYELGAEEFIPKPFHLRELLLRVKHVLASHVKINTLELNDGVVIDFHQMTVKKNNGAIEYPPSTDMKVLELLFTRSPKVVSRDEIMDYVWGEDKNLNLRTVDNSIVRIKKLLGIKNENCIRNVRAVGYQWLKEEG